MTEKKDNPPPARPLNEGYVPVEKGWKPTVQGGYKPTVSQVVATPPSGGSGVKPPSSPPKK
ncbi:hypothetical protein [Sphingomonas bacterium]|uniref:hypothetical protein n=1 Tax=Sphingomonas bacterium TaxID=1895847 RepID=UPI00157543B0|nr:hypothetical protein [Sphingomonas bacterium]